MVYRNFNHPQIGEVLIAENDAKLSIKGSPVKAKIATYEFIQKVFSNDDTQGAKELLANYLKPRMNRDYDSDEDSNEKLMETSQWAKYYHAVPSQFTFCFPNDTYSNETEKVKKSLDTILQFKTDFIS